jgi:hypothetical protein
MTDEPLGGLAAAARKGPGLTPEEVARVERALGFTLPPDYVQFLVWGDGWEGWIGGSYLQLLSRDELPFANDDHFRDAFPGLVDIGGDGGLETYALDYRPDGLMRGVVAVDRNSSDERDIWPVATSFTEALAALASRSHE